MKVSEAIVKILEKEGIEDGFGIPGAGINGLYQYLKESKKIRHYTVRHEEAAVHAAGGYYRSSGRMAVADRSAGFFIPAGNQTNAGSRNRLVGSCL